MNKWLALMITLLLAGGAAAQQLPPGGQEFQAGVKALETKDWDAAIKAFELALAVNTDLFASHYFLGVAYEATKSYAKAAEHFTKYLERVGNNPDAAQQIAYATRQAGLALARVNDPAAIPLLEKAAAAKPNDKDVHHALAVTLVRNNQAAEAEQHFLKVIQLDPNLARPYYFAGRAAFSNERWADAQRLLSKYLELGPEEAWEADTHFMLGSMAIRQGEGAGDLAAAQATAKEHFNKLLELKPNAPEAPQAHYYLGSLAAQSEDWATARMHYQSYLQLQPQGAQAEEVKQFLADLAEDEAAAKAEAANN